MGGQKQLENIKKQIKVIKQEVKQSSLHEQLLYNSLYSFRVKLSKENTRHHLFDNLDGEDADKSASKDKDGYTKKPTKEFTEDDLVAADDNENNTSTGWEYKVKSSPRKASMKDTGIDPNNPYVNKNLDADLSTVIGRHRANRKQINTEAFLLNNKEEKEKSDRQKNSDNDSTQDRSRSDRVDGAKKKKQSRSTVNSNNNKTKPQKHLSSVQRPPRSNSNRSEGK